MFATVSLPRRVWCRTRRHLRCIKSFSPFQKLDEGRFGIQPVDDDDGRVTVMLLLLLLFFFFSDHEQLLERRMWLIQQTLIASLRSLLRSRLLDVTQRSPRDIQKTAAKETNPYEAFNLFRSLIYLFIYLFMYLFYCRWGRLFFSQARIRGSLSSKSQADVRNI